MTDAERLLWSKIRKRQLRDCQFYRQRVIGNFIVDFYCPKGKLVIEVDGGQHYDNGRKKRDKARDDYLEKLGLKILRVSDIEVFKNLNGVMEKIYEIL